MSVEIQQELSRDQARFIRHSLRHPSPSANTPGSVSATSPTVDSPVGQTPTGTNGSSRLLIPSKVEDAYKELNQLADEKIALSQRIIEVLARSRARLDFDLAKVRALQGESEIPNTRSYQPYSGASTPLPIVDSITLSAPPSLGENLRNSLLAPDVLPLSPAATAAAMGSVPKKRRITVTNSIKLPSPIPQASSVGASSASSRSRLSRQAHIPRPPDEDVLELDIDPDAEGDEDLEADDAEDTTIYCFCQKTGAGEIPGPYRRVRMSPAVRVRPFPCASPGVPLAKFKIFEIFEIPTSASTLLVTNLTKPILPTLPIPSLALLVLTFSARLEASCAPPFHPVNRQPSCPTLELARPQASASRPSTSTAFYLLSPMRSPLFFLLSFFFLAVRSAQHACATSFHFHFPPTPTPTLTLLQATTLPSCAGLQVHTTQEGPDRHYVSLPSLFRIRHGSLRVRKPLITHYSVLRPQAEEA
ncbi:hypothetical protein CCMSSC00406_0001156 [Pleurotus cornucopiae]|uniref:Uncharacterized protein n=1 Tax=Pleurotus cornucopiae TaxID=5321 RepID=A0ACB7IM16_PLECO|nr:hypothetical protein CCMSSC00406_0001156 [Pleurotus cornucopiae]